jgi:hypothetical protein
MTGLKESYILEIDSKSDPLKGLHRIPYAAIGTTDKHKIDEAASKLGFDVVYETGGNKLPDGLKVRSRYPDENMPEIITEKLSLAVATLLAKENDETKV